MRKIKDFFYNISDIALAILILLIAAGVILWRMEGILEYPSKVLANSNQEASDPINDPLPNEDPKEDPTNQDEPENDLWLDGVLLKDVSVSVAGESATEAIQCLVDVKIFDSWDEFEAICTQMGMDYNSVRGGDLTFKAGATKEEIAKYMILSY